MGIAALRAALLLASLLALFHAASVPDSAAPAYGRERVAEYELPAEQVARWRAHAQTPAAWAEVLQWIGPRQPAGSGRNPYTLVLSVNGVAPAAGDVRSHWHAGWEVQESPTATRDLLMPLAALSSGSVAAGAPLTLTVVGRPVTFRGERTVAPMLNLAQVHNFEIQSVRLALWSGPVPWAWPQLTASRLALLLVAALCALGWWALRRQATQPQAQADRPEPSNTLPGPRPTPAPALPPTPAPAIEALLARPLAAPPAAPAMAQHAALVVAALRDVLGGIAVPNEPDARHARGRKRGLRTG